MSGLRVGPIGEITWTPSGVGASDVSVQDTLRELVSPLGFGAVGDGVTDDTAAIQAAIDTGSNVDLVGKYYAVNNLTQSTNTQSIISSRGIARLIKNANGPILTSSADDFLMENVNWRGDASSPTFTGDGVVATGARPSFLNCGGRWVSGRALKATGSRVRVKGTCDIYQTTDATATGYDIEIGASGTATLYHELDEIYSSQSTGGILLTDTGSHTIKGGQFGKLTIASGTSPAGVNGGKTVGSRILGDVTVGLSSAIFDAVQFSAVNVTFAAGTSGCRISPSCTFASGATVTNNGNTNNQILREVSTGGGSQLKFGDDSSTAVITVNLADQTKQFAFSGGIVLDNTRGFRIKDTGGTEQTLVVLSSGDDITLGADTGTGNFTNVLGGSGGVYLLVAGTTIAQAYASGFRPQSDDTFVNGTAAQRWANTFSTNFRPGAGTATWTSGAGTPEGAVTATVGSLYTRTDGGAATTLYVKESGEGNTGWVAK